MPRIIDLTLPIHTAMRGVAIDIARTVEKDGWNARTLHLYSHAGTHMDAPTHFAAGPETIDAIPLSRCFGPAHVVPIPDLEPGAEIGVRHLRNVADAFKDGESLLLRTGWSRHVADSRIHRDGLPRVGRELARWCVDRRVRMLGVEPPSVADVNNLPELTEIHVILLRGGVTIVEGLSNLDQLHEPRVLFGALPLPIVGGDGCPCRAFAIEGVPPDVLSAPPA